MTKRIDPVELAMRAVLDPGQFTTGYGSERPSMAAWQREALTIVFVTVTSAIRFYEAIQEFTGEEARYVRARVLQDGDWDVLDPTTDTGLPWRCFHCDEVFDTPEAAKRHFGSGNYEREEPVCIEAATTELKTLVITNREMWERIQKLEGELEQAEHERDCWAEAGRVATGYPAATWHDFAAAHVGLDNEKHAIENMLDAVPWPLAQFFRARAEWRTQSPPKRLATLRRYWIRRPRT